MAEITQANGQTLVDYMARDYDSLLQSMRALIPDKLPEWTDYTAEADFGNVLLQLFAHMGDILSYYQDRIANESFLGTAQTRRSIIQHLRLIGYCLGTAAPATATLTLNVPGNCTKTVKISKGDAFATKSMRDHPSVRFEYTSDVALEINFDSIKPDQDGKKHYAGIPVAEGRLIPNERLGISDGTPNQRFPLAHPRLILRPASQKAAVNNDLILRVENGANIKRWNLRDTLAFSRDDQPDFVVEVDELDRAVVVFGDGKFGRIPSRGAVIKATYRVGGGAQGNVPAQAITTITNAPQLALIGATVTNVAPATGGDDRESIEHAVLQAPAVFRSRKRAVTRDDYEALARNFQGVGKVRAVAAGWNIVTLHVAPAGGGNVSDTLRTDLLAYFEDKRPITTRVEIAGVDYVPIYITAKLEVESYYDPVEVRDRVRTAVEQLLDFKKVDFGQTIYLSKFYEAIEAVQGVRDVYVRGFTRNPSATVIETDGQIRLEENEIPQLPAKGMQFVNSGTGA